MLTDAGEEQRYQRVVQRVAPGSALLRAQRLEGGVSAHVTLLEFERPGGQVEKVLVRRPGRAALAYNPSIAADEFRILQFLHAEGLKTQRPYDLDESLEIFPTPYIVIEYLEGETGYDPSDMDRYLRQATRLLGQLHGVAGAAERLPFLPRLEKGFTERPPVLDDSLQEGRIRDALEAALPALAPMNPPALVHGDYWPGNLLWREGELAGVIDWEDARIADPLDDVCGSRLEFLWVFGVEAMHEFTRHYQATSALDFTNLAYWDLCAALRPCSKISYWGLDAATEQDMREKHSWFVEQALQKLNEMA